jgi:hypothetical protein
MLQGVRIVWESTPIISQSPTLNPPYLCNPIPIEKGKCVGDEVSGGIYRDRNRFLAVLYVAPEGGHGRHHLLGRFDSEEEANAAYKWVRYQHPNQDIQNNQQNFVLWLYDSLLNIIETVSFLIPFRR